MTSDTSTGVGRKRRFPDSMRRHAGRLAAVQALYQLEIAGGTVEAAIETIVTSPPDLLLDATDGAAPDAGLTGRIARAVVVRREEITDLVTAALSKDWRFSRLEVLMKCIFWAGTSELLMDAADRVPVRVIISEYVDIAHAFYSGKEPAMVNAVLDNIARVLRPGEMEAGPAGGGAARQGDAG